MLLQPVELHLKKIIEEVKVDETINSLQNEEMDKALIGKSDEKPTNQPNEKLTKCNEQLTEIQLLNRSKINVSKNSIVTLETNSLKSKLQ